MVLGDLLNGLSPDAVKSAIACMKGHGLSWVRRIQTDAHKCRPATLKVLFLRPPKNPIRSRIHGLAKPLHIAIDRIGGIRRKRVLLGECLYRLHRSG